MLRFDIDQQYDIEKRLGSDKTYFNWKAAFDECKAPGATGAKSQMNALMCSIEQCNGAGLGCTSLTSVILPDTFEILEARFVKNCTSLTYIRIPASVTTIEYEAFQGTSITSISLPDGLTLIDSETFSNCTQLTSITIPASVTEIKYNAFLNCNNLTTINYKGSEEEKNNIIINASGNSILSSITWNYNYTEN